MRRLLLSTAAAALLLPAAARADVIIDNNLSGTGDNVVFDSLVGNLAVGRFNGQHQGLVDFTDLSNNPLFTGAANGNDIKIANTDDLKVQVFANDGVTVLPTATDVFSLKGDGSVQAFVTANETDGTTKLFTFSLGTINNSQSGFTLTAINGETINQFALVDTGGTITDFEHYRIDVAAPVGAPGPEVASGLPGVLAMLAFAGFVWNRRRQAA